ncbi:MAG: MotA/TolQ/ExbB proton channel family protein [Gammaproteobacteria bacterium]|nr:MotA/TolQ/ExbB proton channel family protein [Gammaproteobacteria bacterium]NIN37221.1 MotA/TolQ/ExbB proton channel family protein [Gammaproteobacteria bacterium]NIO26079.1 MotA/TolQ/ExbB proton channel family protein [Gammaproteobacteria bacterium]NIO66692.1 MotA/TolQ/ExbB proton channel family protein [Gammaproteobacteria bacterium]NIP46369.1 MotA/TolQ/ExbB proton channel family protein [Gammaproteobacteria bacterium]
MKKDFPTEFVYQVFSLLIAIIVVHAVYVAVIRPDARAFIQEQAEIMQADPSYVPERSLTVIIKDYEQEACFILMFWAFAIIIYKAVATYRQRRLLDTELILLAEDMRILPQDTRELSRKIQALPRAVQSFLLPRTLTIALQRFAATGNIQDVSTSVREVSESEAERLESELSIIRYIAWAIPSIGFIGTVRGIGDALGQAHKAVEGDITGVTQSLGVAFNSTFIALVISIVLMFFIYQLQLMQERLVLDTEYYCDEHLIRHLQVR